MLALNYAETLKKLADDHYHRRLSSVQYRAQRKLVLDEIDEKYNNRSIQTLLSTEPSNDQQKNNTVNNIGTTTNKL